MYKQRSANRGLFIKLTHIIYGTTTRVVAIACIVTWAPERAAVNIATGLNYKFY